MTDGVELEVLKEQESVNLGTKKCKRCSKYYTDDKSTCFYHPGEYVYPTLGAGTMAGWTCCRKMKDGEGNTVSLMKWKGTPMFQYVDQKALELNAPGCKSLPQHLEDKEFSAIICNFPLQEQDDNKTGQEQKEEEEEEEEEKEKKKKKKEEDKETENFYIHKVRSSDTLVGLSLRYRIPIDTLKKVNKINNFDDNNAIYTRKYLRIPKNKDNEFVQDAPEESEDFKKRKLVRQFASITGAQLDEARFYLEDYNFILKKAIAEWNEDKKWENRTSKTQDNHFVFTPNEKEQTSIIRGIPLLVSVCGK